MLELLICSLLTVFPDYLIRRYAQGKRLGREITLFSVWFELRYGIVACLILTITLITTIFYFHPTSRDVSFVFRTIPIVPEVAGTVAEVHVGPADRVEAGAPLFTLDDSRQRAAVETAERRIAEIAAERDLAVADLAAAQGQIGQAEGALAQAQDELDRTLELQARNPDVVAQREVDRLRNAVDARRGALDAAEAAREAVEARLRVYIPAREATAQAQLEEARVELEKTVIRAGVSGELEQFVLRPGDFVNPILRPAGVLVADTARQGLFAGFGEIEAQIVKAGMVGEITCAALPFTIIPVRVTAVQDTIASGQIRAQDQLFEISQTRRNATILALLEPLHQGGLDRLPKGARCVANAYSRFHGTEAAERATGLHAIGLHIIDTVAIVHAILLRIEALLLPFQTLVLGGH
jgi:multidrug resistance efflux pump